jgi:P pilus assembly chaperone PapD
MKRVRIAALLLAILPMPALAELGLSQVIVDLSPGAPPRDDIEVSNDGAERIYVVAEPFEIINPGQASEKRVAVTDPGTSGLLVTPQRLILEPGEKRLLRIAMLSPRATTDRIFRITVKPVVGEVTAQKTALKLLVGYDVLAIYRPEANLGKVVGTRNGRLLTLSNIGNSNVEIYDGKHCDPAGENCAVLPARRLYAGMSLAVPLSHDTPVSYKIHDSGRSQQQDF